MAGLLEFLQAASNSAASNVSGPVDGLAWLLRKAGIDVGEPVGGSAWMERQGLTRPVKQSGASLAGETAGLLAPIAAAAKAPQIAKGLLQIGENAAAPANVNRGMSGGQRGIVPASYVKEVGGSASLPTDELFAQAAANTPGASITADGLLMRLQRNQAPEQGMRPSVRGGVFYLPEGAQQAKHYSTGKSGYGGSERITGETLIQNPLFVKGATGGKAPEAAIDKLLGKGSYQKIRDEALSSVLGYGKTEAQKIEDVSKFLSKHAPELADQAAYIVKNSKVGNQLAYALQEAAVGSAVRRAGHDAVLGYSKQKTGAPFFSEVFDVRERVYPDKFGGFDVWGN